MRIPLGGNSWVIHHHGGDSASVSNEGWNNWEDPATVFTTYFYLAKPGNISLSAVLAVPTGVSTIQSSIGGQLQRIKARGSSQSYVLGSWKIIHAGYVKVLIQGVQKTGKRFADIHELLLSGHAVDTSTAFVKNNDDNFFHWGRRGPSVHLNYDLSAIKDSIDWFYNEVTIPKGNDVIGSFFMADGFAEGYFGMQVNSDSERRVLFSVWSPYKTDNPSQIPEDQKIILLDKGPQATTAAFGNEGSGGQSYLRFPWKAGKTYKFLLHATPAAHESTIFSAYFLAPEFNQWMLIARFNRPQTQTYLTRLHSFLENFEPETGNITRKAWYGNQWVRTVNGKWVPIQSAVFTADATAKKRYRLDYSGGVEENHFFLRNAGFFNDSTAIHSTFHVQPAVNLPAVLLDLPH